jgi:deoxyribodipyrimidine photo-lyase
VSTVIHWFRRDLRLRNNTALAQAARDAACVVAVFILHDRYAEDPNVGPARFQFLRESLEDLGASLFRAGGRPPFRLHSATRSAMPRSIPAKTTRWTG